jgi:hypothetical protein
MARPVKVDVQKEFAYWLATPKRLRVSLGLPVSETQFCQMKSVNQKTLRRWKAQEPFQKLVESFRLELANAAPNSAISRVGVAVPVVSADDFPKVRLEDDPVVDYDLSPDEQKYLQVKDTLVQMAMDGNQGAMDLYLKHYGKAFVEAEQSDFSDYKGMSDGDLIAELCRMAGVERISAWLAEQASETV